MKSNDGLDIEIYSPWTIVEYIYNGKVDNYWADRISNKIRKQIGHPKIRMDMLNLMGGEYVRIKYKKNLEIDDIERLCEIVNKSEINGDDVHLFFQFFYELRILRLTNLKVDYSSLKIPNESVRQLIDLHPHKYDSIRAYYNHSPKLIHEFIESLKNRAQSCNKKSARDLVNSVERLFTEGRTALISEYEFQSILYTYILQHFGKYVVSERITSNRNRCDTVVHVKIYEVVIVFEFKLKRGNSKAGYKQIMDKQY
ncbi:hypothetical protein PV325_010039 [Microctonus aethiopoides]|uniref:Uncharacterized protein n=1 Tax=Microctonus aethiopoides TaxID=144406 RepID=A0AA39KJL5_9HYME|nr:hypothetical protein PV325_010039 [Microctonus aethiopoides]KAK0163751.1 hypothetical protein PV328_002449 [Microctonus aethiopoides]